MNVVESRTHLKRRVDSYLWRDDSLPVQRLRETLLEHFMPTGEVAIIGGLLRDLARKGPSGYKSDIDLVINVPPSQVDRIARKLGAKRNRFGGYGLQTPLWKIDFWALRNTWAHVEGHARIKELKDLPKVTFFNVDAIAYILATRELIAGDGYINSIYNRQLEINLLPNPSVDGNMVRAVRRILAWNMRIGPKLKEFIRCNLDETMFEHVVKMEMALYQSSLAAQYETVDKLIAALIAGPSRQPPHSDAASQYHLPF